MGPNFGRKAIKGHSFLAKNCNCFEFEDILEAASSSNFAENCRLKAVTWTGSLEVEPFDNRNSKKSPGKIGHFGVFRGGSSSFHTVGWGSFVKDFGNL